MSLVTVLIAVSLSLAAGVLPTVLYAYLVWRLDRFEKEPLKLLAVAFLWGALPAAVLSVLLEVVLSRPAQLLAPEYSQVIGASLIAPLVEESVKGLALLGLFWLARHEFDDVLDGVLYGALIGFGFAMTENVFYFLRAAQQGVARWSFVVLGRAVIFGFNHAMFTAFTGIGLGLARYTRSARGRLLFFLLGLGTAMFVHFWHNFFLTATNLCLISFVADWFGVLVILGTVVWAWSRERGWMRSHLEEEVALGVLTPLQAETISSRRGRIKHEWQLLGISGLTQARQWRRLADDAAELAFKKHQLAAMGEERGNSSRIADLRARVFRLRRSLGDEVALRSRLCSHCSRPSVDVQAVACPHCGGAWLEE